MNQVLLHCCCAPCSSAIIEWMMQHDITPVLYYFNPNIYPYEEYLIRKNELTRYATGLGLQVIDDDWSHDQWLNYVKGFENEPEKGSRCLLCFKYRLERAACKALELGIPSFTTTLASSRWKSLEQITTAGEWAAEKINKEIRTVNPEVNESAFVTFDARNWRKGRLQDRRNQLLKENGFYNQLYCGCEFSMRKSTDLDCRAIGGGCKTF